MGKELVSHRASEPPPTTTLRRSGSHSQQAWGSCLKLTWPSRTAPSTSASCLPSCRRTESPAFLGGESSRSHRTTVGTEACWKLARLCRRQEQLAWFGMLPGVHKFTSTVCGCVPMPWVTRSCVQTHTPLPGCTPICVSYIRDCGCTVLLPEQARVALMGEGV